MYNSRYVSVRQCWARHYSILQMRPGRLRGVTCSILGFLLAELGLWVPPIPGCFGGWEGGCTTREGVWPPSSVFSRPPWLCPFLASRPLPTRTCSQGVRESLDPAISERPCDRPSLLSGSTGRAVLDGKPVSAFKDVLGGRLHRPNGFAHSRLQHWLVGALLVSDPHPSCCTVGLFPAGWLLGVFPRTGWVGTSGQ